jgi:hypothetical protein
MWFGPVTSLGGICALSWDHSAPREGGGFMIFAFLNVRFPPLAAIKTDIDVIGPERSVECASMPQCGFSKTDTQTCRSDLILVCSPSFRRLRHMVFHCFVAAQPVV